MIVIPLLNHGAAVAAASTPLLSVSNGSAEQDDEDDGNPESRGMFSTYYEHKCDALFLGVLAGFFIQFATLVVNFLVLYNRGDNILRQSRNDFVCFSLAWSFVTSTLSIVILNCLRNVMSATYTISLRRTSSKNNSKGRVEERILLLDCLFVVGALIGLCVAWTATDLLIGAHAQAIHSAATLVVSLTWSMVVISYWLSSKEEENEATDNSSQQKSVDIKV
jgi:divalent metal cation (Fe/Co/Zn/Cd) transporter